MEMSSVLLECFRYGTLLLFLLSVLQAVLNPEGGGGMGGLPYIKDTGACCTL